MFDSTRRKRLISEIHDSRLKLNLVITGGGAKVIGELLAVPGASNTVSEAIVPYSKESLADFIGAEPESSCSAATAKIMAASGFMRPSFRQEKRHGNVASIACTAALATSRPKKGEHRCFIASQNPNKTRLFSAQLKKGLLSREDEELLVCDLILNEIAKQVGLEAPIQNKLLDHQFLIDEIDAPMDWADVFAGTRSKCLAETDVKNLDNPAQTQNKSWKGTGLLSGSFNPLHAGHLQMSRVAEQILGTETEFEMTILNADKPPLDFLTIRDRKMQFQNKNLWLTGAATFTEKANLFPGAVFLVGIDTVIRIADPGYYGGEAGLVNAIDVISKNQCRFLVFGRVRSGKFQTLKNMDLPAKLISLCQEVTETEYRNDSSSTAIRRSRSSQTEATS